MKKNVIVLDDDINILNIMKKYLIKLGFNPILSNEPKDFFKKVKQFSPETVIIDLILNNNKIGFEIIEETKRIDNYITIVGLSGYSNKENIIKAMECGATFFLSKPFNFSELKDLFSKIILQRQYIDMSTIDTQSIEYEKRIVNINNDINLIHPTINQLLFLFKHILKDEAEKIRVGLFEALMNAIEHGNLEIDYETKRKALQNGNFDELIISRLLNDDTINKQITITMEFNKKDSTLIFSIKDQGKGFDWQKYLYESDIDSDQFNGRGIRIMRYAFDEIVYNNKGNEVKLIKKINPRRSYNMVINKEKIGDQLIVKIKGEIDNSQSETLKKYLTEIVDEVESTLVLDFGGVSFIGSSGIGKILSLYKTLDSKGIKIEIVNLNDDIYMLFSSFRLDKLFTLRKKQ